MKVKFRTKWKVTFTCEKCKSKIQISDKDYKSLKPGWPERKEFWVYADCPICNNHQQVFTGIKYEEE